MFGIATREYDDEVNVKLITNGYIITLRGRDLDDNWITRQVFAEDFDTMTTHLSDFFNLDVK